MSKKNKKRRNRHLGRQPVATGTGQPISPQKSSPSDNARGLDTCPRCSNKLRPDKELSGLTYCAHCSLFFWITNEKKTTYPLSTALAALKRFGGTDILFSDRIPGLVSAISPDTKEGVLEILRRLSKPETHSLVEAIRKEEVLNEIEISVFVNKSGLDRQNVIKVCNALRLAINKKEISDTETSDLKSHYILTFSASLTEAYVHEKIKIQWSAIEDSYITYILTTEKGSEKVKPNGSLWITINSLQTVTLQALYKRQNELESRTITIKPASPPIIHHLSSNLSFPVMETEKIKINWHVENADRVTLAHRYNDYEKLSVDVTELVGEFSFTALRTELLELTAERRNVRTTKSLMIDVIPLPKMKVSELPQITEYPDIDIARISNLTASSKIEELFNTLREISSFSGLSPYKSLKGNLSEFFRLIYKIIK